MKQRLQMNLSGEVLDAFDIVREIRFNEQNKNMSREDIVSILLDEIYPIYHEINWKNIYSFKIPRINNERKGIQTALMLETKYVEQLTLLQSEFSKIIGTSRVFKPFVIKMLLTSDIMKNDYFKESKKSEEPSKNESPIKFIVDNRIDFLVFKNEFDHNINEKKNDLYDAIKLHLEANPELLSKLRKQINCWIRGISDYYNVSKYTPSKRKNFATGNIIFITKAVAGVLLVQAEIEGLDIENIIDEIQSDN